CLSLGGSGLVVAAVSAGAVASGTPITASGAGVASRGERGLLFMESLLKAVSSEGSLAGGEGIAAGGVAVAPPGAPPFGTPSPPASVLPEGARSQKTRRPLVFSVA